MFLRNCWYVAAWASEIDRAPLARTFLDQPVMLYRAADGEAVALEDRCCHRNLPLSMGRIEGDDVRCGYHGLKFDRTGACIEIPGQAQIPAGAGVRRYPLLERWGLVWIWPGAVAAARAEALPHWQYLAEPGWSVIRGNDAKPVPMKCHWELNNDNLLDLSHVTYVHPSTLGAHGADRYPVQTERLDHSVRMIRWMPNVQPIPMWKKLLSYDGNVDRWQVTEAEIPGHCTVDAGFAPAGQATLEKLPVDAPRIRVLLTATPETATSSFLFYAQIRNFGVDDAELTARFQRDSRVVFDEDVAVLEAQQRVNSALPDAPTIDIRSDAPHLAMRKLVREFMAVEQAGKG